MNYLHKKKKRFAPRLLTALVMIALVAIAPACEEDSLTENNPAPSSDNLFLRFVALYDGQPISSDSLKFNSFGNRFFVDSVRFMISDYFFSQTQTGDTIDDKVLNLTSFSTAQIREDVGIGRISPGNYSGHHHLVVGMDSITTDSLLIKGNSLTEGDPTNLIDDSRFRREDQFGFNHLQIYGRLLNFQSPDTAAVPLEFNIGTYFLADTIKANNPINFGVDNQRRVLVILQIEIEPMLNSFDLAKPNNIVKSKPSEIVDMELARTMMDTLRADIF